MTDIYTLNERARLIFSQIVEAYLETGDAIGSQSLSQSLEEKLSPATIRNTMAELEALGLLYAPHISSGRLPTEIGLRFFVDGLLQVGQLNAEEQAQFAPHIKGEKNLKDIATQAIDRLSGLSQCAGLVVVPQNAHIIKHIEFLPLSHTQILVILVDENNNVENRLIDRPEGISRFRLNEASNYLNMRLRGQSIDQFKKNAESEINTAEKELGTLTAALVEQGLVEWAGNVAEDAENNSTSQKNLIIRGHAHLLDNVHAVKDIERIRVLFEDLERKKELINLLSQSEHGEGVRIFIGAETKLFSLSGSSLIISGYKDANERLIGALGVIAPTRSDYARIIPMVDYTARIVSDILKE